MRHLIKAPIAFLITSALAAQVGEVLSKTEALALAFPHAVHAIEWQRAFADGERARLEKRVSRRLADRGYFVYLLSDGEGPCGLAVITAEIGKTERFTFLVGIGLDRRVHGLHVMDYHEPKGFEVRRRSFREQFLGSSLQARFRLRREIENIPGATLSAVAVTRGVRKVLTVVDMWFRGMDADQLQRAFVANGERLALPTRVRSMHRESFPAMGTVCSLVLEGVNAALAARLSKEVRAVMRKTEARLSNWSPDSELSRALASRSRDGAVKVSAELFADVWRAMAAAEESKGAFDPTIYAALKRSTRASSGHGPDCSSADLDALRARVGYGKLRLHTADKSLRFATAGMGISTDAFAKGLAVDRAVAVLRRHGVRRARVGFRSTFYLLGDDHKVTMPNGEVLSLANCAVAAAEAKPRGEPILDPRTLMPAEFTGTAVVVAPDGFNADWLATAAAVIGPKDAAACLRKSGRRFCFSPPRRTP